MNVAALLWTMAFSLTSVPTSVGATHEVVTSPFALPGGIADPAGRNGFLVNADGGIAAIDLRNGKVLWETTSACRPILTTGDRLYASARTPTGQLCVVALDLTHKGEELFRSDPIDWPADAGHRPATVRWVATREHLCVLREVAGTPGPVASAEVDIRTGHIHVQTNVPPAAIKVPAADLERKAVRWQGGVGDAYKALVLEDTAAGQQLILYSWNATTGQPLPAKPLLQGKRLLMRSTVNGQHLCLRDAMPSPDQRLEGQGRHAWSVFDVSTGDLVARLPYEPGTQAIAVLGPRAYYVLARAVPGSVGHAFVSPRALRAIDAKTGATLWERPAESKRLTPVGT